MRACLHELRKRLEENHGKCAETLTKKAAADAQAAAAVSAHTPNVMQVMMLFQQVQHHAKSAQDQAQVANKVALETEKENDAPQKEVPGLPRVMEPKRARTHVTTANDHEECDKKSSDDMDLADHRREATRIQNRRSVPLGTRVEVPTPQEGQGGPMEHSRLGLVGWIAYWSLGNCALAVKIIVGLISEWVVKTLPLAKSGVWGSVQARAQWSTEEDAHMRPGHHWLCEFGDSGNDTSCEKHSIEWRRMRQD
jgi:hypothetical protein